MRLANFYNNKAGSYDELYSPAYNVSTIPVGTIDQMTFRYAYTGKAVAASLGTSADTVYDALKINFSKDCGATWTLKFNKSGAALSTANPITTGYKPSSTTDWVEETINLANILNGDNIRMKFEFHSNSGNNLYIDDINITTAQTSVADNILLQDLQFNIQPNPVSDNTIISFNLTKSENVKLNVMNLLGQEMINVADGNLSAGQYKYVVNRADFGNAGFYIVKINVDGNIITKKIIVK